MFDFGLYTQVSDSGPHGPLVFVFFFQGLCIAVPGPTLLDLAEKINTDITHISTIFSARAVGYLLGAIVGGALFSYFDKQLLMFCTLLICSIATIAVPWCFTLVAMGSLVALQGLSLGILYTGKLYIYTERVIKGD